MTLRWFERKTIYIVADKDEPGRQHAQQVAASLYSVAETVRIVEMPTGKDVSEWLDNGGDTGQLIDICRSFPISRLDADGVADPVDGAELLADVHALSRALRRLSVRSRARRAHVSGSRTRTLMDAWDSTPRIAFLSPEPGSGKTRALEVSEMLVPNPVEAVNVTPAYLFRKVGQPRKAADDPVRRDRHRVRAEGEGQRGDPRPAQCRPSAWRGGWPLRRAGQDRRDRGDPGLLRRCARRPRLAARHDHVARGRHPDAPALT